MVAGQVSLDAEAGSREELALADASLVSYFRLLATTAVGGQIDEGPGYLSFAGAHDYPGTYTNGAIRVAGEGTALVTPSELLARADGFFWPLKRPFVAWVRTHHDADLAAELTRRGCWVRPPEQGSEAVLLRTSPEGWDEPQGVDLFEAQDERDLREFVLLAAVCYQLPDADLALAESLLFSVASLQDPGSRVYLARDRASGRLCGGITTYSHGGVDHNAWAVTDPEVRGRGVGRALTQMAAHGSFAHGARFVWGVASVKGAPIWKTIGFETVARYQRFVVPFSS